MVAHIGQIVKSPDGLGRVVDTLFGEYQIMFEPGVFAWYKAHQLKKECQCAHCKHVEFCEVRKQNIYKCNNLEVTKWQ